MQPTAQKSTAQHSTHKCFEPVAVPLAHSTGTTTADLMLEVVSAILEGSEPTTSNLVAVRSALLRGADVYQPLMDVRQRIAEVVTDVSFYVRTVGTLPRKCCPSALLHAVATDCTFLLIHIPMQPMTQYNMIGDNV